MEFSGYAVWLLQVHTLQIYYGFLFKEHLSRTQERLESDFSEHCCERSLKLLTGRVFKEVGLFLLTGGAGIVHVQGCGMHWCFTC